MSTAAMNVLMVEDNPADIRLTREAFRSASVPVTLHVVRDGVEAIAYLYRRTPHEEAPRPDMVLLDLNLPRKDGREVLAEMKADPSLRRIPVVILTTSMAEQDVLRSYDLHANCYLVKPLALDRFMAVIRSIEDFWMRRVTLPPGEH